MTTRSGFFWLTTVNSGGESQEYKKITTPFFVNRRGTTTFDTQVFWDRTPCKLVVTDVSEEPTASIKKELSFLQHRFEILKPKSLFYLRKAISCTYKDITCWIWRTRITFQFLYSWDTKKCHREAFHYVYFWCRNYVFNLPTICNVQ